MRVNISRIFKKLLRLLEDHLNMVVLLFFIIIILYASWLFYNFVYKPVSVTPEAFFERVEIEKETFERVTGRLELREKNILEAMSKKYKNIFK